MAVELGEQDGQTPLDPDEKAGLIPQYLTTKDDLNDWEQENILRAVRWMKRVRPAQVLSEGFCRELHKQMFGKTWAWAGTFRKSDKNIGCDWTQVAVRLMDLFDNTRWWVDNATFPTDEIAARFHRDLVWIHPFPNGNGRHSRMMADALLRSLGQTAFTWGSGGSLVAANDVRAQCTWQPCELQTKVTTSLCLRLFEVEPVSPSRKSSPANYPTAASSPNTMLMGLLPWCD